MKVRIILVIIMLLMAVILFGMVTTPAPDRRPDAVAMAADLATHAQSAPSVQYDIAEYAIRFYAPEDWETISKSAMFETVIGDQGPDEYDRQMMDDWLFSMQVTDTEEQQAGSVFVSAFRS